MKNWETLKNEAGYKVNDKEQHSFHLVCYTKLEERLEQIVEKHFTDFKPRERPQVINSILSIMAPLITHHMNLDSAQWVINLEEGNRLSEREKREIQEKKGDKRATLMERELWVPLDKWAYRLLKKVHEGWGTFSMAFVLRAVLSFALDLIDSLGRDGFWFWVKEWLERHENGEAMKSRKSWRLLEKHMKFFKDKNVKYIALYYETYVQKYLYHPPPDKNNT